MRVKSVTAHEDELLPGVRGRDASSSFDASPLLGAKTGSIEGSGALDPSQVDLVELEYFVEEHEEWDDEGRRAVERLKAGLSKLEGVLRVRGTFFACAVHASPRPTALSHPGGGGTAPQPAFGGNPKRNGNGNGSRNGSRNGSKSSSPLGPTGRSGGGAGGYVPSSEGSSLLMSGSHGDGGGGGGGSVNLGSFSLGALSLPPSMRIEVSVGNEGASSPGGSHGWTSSQGGSQKGSHSPTSPK